MKKLLFVLVACLALGFSSCQKEDEKVGESCGVIDDKYTMTSVYNRVDYYFEVHLPNSEFSNTVHVDSTTYQSYELDDTYCYE